MQAAHQTLVRTFGDLHNHAFPASATVHSRGPDHRAVAMHQFAHFLGSDKKIIATFISYKKSESIWMADYFASDKVQFLRNQKRAFAVAKYLSIARHRGKATRECLLLLVFYF